MKAKISLAPAASIRSATLSSASAPRPRPASAPRGWRRQLCAGVGRTGCECTVEPCELRLEGRARGGLGFIHELGDEVPGQREGVG